MRNFISFAVISAVFTLVFGSGCAEPMPIRANYLPLSAEHEGFAPELAAETVAEPIVESGTKSGTKSGRVSERTESKTGEERPGTMFYIPEDGLDFITPPELLDFEEMAAGFDIILSQKDAAREQGSVNMSALQAVSVPLDSAPAETQKQPRKQSSKQLQGVININTAPAETLVLLPGVGPSLAGRIIDYRGKRKFTQPTHLRRVKGIGRVKFEKVKDYIVVTGETTLTRS